MKHLKKFNENKYGTESSNKLEYQHLNDLGIELIEAKSEGIIEFGYLKVKIGGKEIKLEIEQSDKDGVSVFFHNRYLEDLKDLGLVSQDEKHLYHDKLNDRYETVDDDFVRDMFDIYQSNTGNEPQYMMRK